MEAGIVAYGAYIPIYRLSRSEIARVWGGGSQKGERAVANCDEDSLTMGVEAGLDCLRGIDRSSVDRLYFASTTAPYREKRSSSIIAAALDLRGDVVTADFSNSLGAGANALNAALDAVNAGAARNVLVIAADCRVPPPNSSFEHLFGDGAAALLVGAKDVMARLEGSYTLSIDFLDIWRKDRGDTYVRTWEDRFIIEKGYMAHMQEAISQLLNRAQLKPADITRAAYYAPDPRSHVSMGRRIGLEKNQIQDPMFDALGNTGTSFFMMLLVSAFEKASAGDRLLAASYGDGVDAWVFRIIDRVKSIEEKRGIEKHLRSKMMLPSYGTYLKFRKLVEFEATHYPPPESSANVFYREQKALTKGYGVRCLSCGHVQFPPQRICMWCQSKDSFEDVRIVERKGKLFTFSLDERAVFALDLPNALVIVDLDGGGRVYSQATDRDPQNLHVGMDMEFTFRRFHEGSGFYNYSWKCRPVRC